MPSLLDAQQVYDEVRHGLGPDLCRLMDMPDWSDIEINSDGSVYMDSKENVEIKGCRVNANGLLNAALVLAGYWGQSFNSTTHQSLNCIIPIAGLRANFERPPAVPAICATFRKPNPHLFTMDEQVRNGTMTGNQKLFLEAAIRDHKNIIFSGGTGCHAKGTLILMADGSSRKVEDIKEGDRLMGDDGSVRTVTALHRGREMMYRITPSKGEPFVVNGGHILSLKGLRNGRSDTEISVREYLSKSNNWKNKHYLYYCSGVKRFERPFSVLPIPPYVLGILLGDGSMTESNRLTLCTPDEEVAQAFDEWITSRGWQMKRKNRTGCPIYCINLNKEKGGFNRSSFRHEDEYICVFRRLGLYNHTAKDKFIPDIYKYGDESERLQILAGLLDTDGYLDPRGYYEFCSKSPFLADDIAFTARSLGFYASVNDKKSSCQNGFTGMYKRVRISGDIERIPCRVKKKKAQFTDEISAYRNLVTSFTVEEAGEDDYYGFETDGNHLYCLSNFMVMHNSGKTSCANSLITLIDPRERIISIEDVRELIFDIPDFIPGSIRKRNVITSLVNRDFTYADGIAAALRQRPDRIIIGECRYGNQALEMLKAWNTGHPGGISTLHANSAEDVFRRLEQLCGEVSASSQLSMIEDAVDVVCQMERVRGSSRRILKELYDVRNKEYIK